MKIDSYSINMTSRSFLEETYEKQEKLESWFENDVGGGNTPPFFDISDTAGILELSEEGLNKQAALSKTGCADNEEGFEFELSDRDRQKLLMLQKFIENLTGKKIRFYMPGRIKLEKTGIKINEAASQSNSSGRAGWGLEYELHESYTERQNMNFNAAGIIKTADGREISLDISLSMSREFTQRQDIILKAGDAKIDPLVINFGNSTAELTDEKISFDIDCDGNKDNISFLKSGSGFLALDLNNDGRINDGHELFGPKSGDGFSELAAYDADKNNWIDENDPIYEGLRIWTRDEEGRDRLIALGEAGVGAVYLGNISTPYSIKDDSNNGKGEIVKTGIYIKEDGTARTIQHVDLSV